MVRPVPIPNTAVKHSLADGSGFIDSARVGCRQFFLKAETVMFRLFLLVETDEKRIAPATLHLGLLFEIRPDPL